MPDTPAITSFVGRERELTELSRLLLDGVRLVTVTAPGGYGKSRLAAELLNVLRHNHGRECYEVLLAPLDDYRRIPWALAEVLGLHLASDSEPLDQLASSLNGRRAILHFDNFEHLQAGNEFIAGLLERVPDLRIVVTSREILRLPDEYVFELEPLPVENGASAFSHPHQPAALMLFANRAQRADRSFILTDENDAAVAEICRELDGVPLAIELVAAWSGTYDLAELTAQLRHQLDIQAPAEEGPRRQASLRASCDWSYALLNEYEQATLRCLSVFRGGFTLSAAQAVLPSIDLEETLTALAEKSWMFARATSLGVRYFMANKAIREYAYQQLLASDDYELAVGAHCRHFGQLLESLCEQLTTAEQFTALKALDTERENLYTALDTALMQSDPTLVQPLARYLQEYLLIIGAARPCADYYTRIADYAASHKDRHLQAQADLALGYAYTRLADYATARRHCEQAAERFGQLSDTAAQAEAWIALGEIERLESNLDQARFQFNRGLAALRETGDLHGLSNALFGLGRVAENESDFALARELINESLSLSRELGDKYDIALCLNSLGNMAYREGDYISARALHSESLRLRRSLGDRRGIAQSLSNLGNVEFAESDYSAAWTLYADSLRIRRDIGELFGQAASLNNLGNVQYCEGNFADAQQLHLDGLEIKRTIGDYIGCSYSLNNLGNIAIRLGDYALARAQLAEAVKIAREVGNRECMIAPVALIANLLARTGKHRVSAILAAGVRRQLEVTGLAMDPMDGGMLEEGERDALENLAASDQLEVKEAGAEMGLDDLIDLALRELD
ncbi:tetratricopeptide repeat protein [bacterium]|nr:tetratricopeptide repeat protein [bacterium]